MVFLSTGVVLSLGLAVYIYRKAVYIYMASASLIHARCCYSPRVVNRRNGSPTTVGSSSCGPYTSSSSSSSHCCASSSSFWKSDSHHQTLSFSSDDSHRLVSFGSNSDCSPFGLGHQAMSTTRGKSIDIGNEDMKNEPDHLLVLVHGIMASPSDWTYAEAELKRRLGRNFLIYVSSCNTYTKTFAGIDVAGKRLAQEVMQLVQKTRSLKRISFLSHSLGGLFTRYAIAVLYSSNNFSIDQHGNLSGSVMDNSQRICSSNGGLIAGLEPINFITLATPHLGVRGRKQLPILLGVPFLEKLAPPMAPIFVGQTGSQLFLTDGKPNKPPLLLRMASDCEDGKFISALGAFRCRIIYANVSYDHIVGWRTSSIRRETELVNPPRRSLDGYKHVVDVEYCPPFPSDGPHFPPEAARAKEAAQNTPSTQNTVEYHEIMEEEMIRGLQQLGWKKVDVSFHSAIWPFFAHNNIHVKNEWLHNAGAGVIAHVTDSLKQQESSTVLAASL